jgi:NTE family protein
VGDAFIEDCSIKLATVATDLRSKKIHVFRSGEIWKAVRASMSIPGIFTPVEEDGMILVDGGVLNRMPINEAKNLGADIVIAVDAVGAPFRDVNAKSLTSIIDVSISLMGWNAARMEYNDADLVIVPEMGTRSQFRFKNNTEAIEAGRAATIEAMPKILEIIKKL